jgi:glucose 1-dehydrogenase
MIERFLAGQKALVTGGSSGIGAATALELARSGADVLVNYYGSPNNAEAVADQCRAHDVDAFPVQADVADAAEVDAMFDQARERFGRLDILVNNAGMQDDAPLLDMSEAAWNRVIGVNLTGQFLCTQRAARLFAKQSPREGAEQFARGKIVFVSSVHDVIPWAGHINYASSKGGVRMLMKTAAQELAEQRIRVNAVAPGAIKTGINKGVWSDETSARGVVNLIPYGRWGEPDDIGKAVAWLCSDAADYITGSVLYIDGGMTLYPEFRDNG